MRLRPPPFAPASALAAGGALHRIDYPVPGTTVVDNQTVTASYLPNEGETVWVFIWETTYPSSYDEVEITGPAWPNPCAILAMGKRSRVLDMTDDDVTVFTQSLGSNRYQHRLYFRTTCVAPCSITYKVRSYAGSTGSVSGSKTLTVPICGFIQN